MNVERFALVTNDKAGAGGETALRNEWDFLRTNLTNANDVIVVSAYYGEEFIRNIMHATNFSGRGRRLTFAFAGLPEVARDEQVKGLNQLRKDILQAVRCPSKIAT